MKKFLLTLLGVLLALPGIARDFKYEYKGLTLTYTVLDEEAKTVKTKSGVFYNFSYTPGNTVAGDLVIPAIAKDGDVEYSVTEIGDYAFNDCSGLTSVTIGNSVTSIGSSAFEGCSGLTSVTIGNSVTSIGYDAFSGCSGLTSVTLGNSVKTIGRSAFSGCKNLTSVNIGNSVKTIDGYAFYGCSGLTSVIIPRSVTYIGENAFMECSGLIKSAYPSTISDPFSKGIRVAYNPYGAIIEDGWIYGPEKSEIRFAPYTLTGDYIIPGSVTSIGSEAFKGCSGLTSVIIPGSVTTIGYYAFSGCSGLKKSAYPSTILDPFSNGICVAYNPKGAIIEDGWIFGPEKSAILFAPYTLTGDYIIPDSVTSIGSNAFEGCSGLTSVIIDNSVKTIGYSAFSGCSGLIKSAYPSTILNPFSNGICVAYNPKGAIIEDGWIFGPEKSAILFAPYTLTGDYIIPDSVTSIGSSAFEGCSGLTSVIIPDSVTSIGDYAFYGCSGLEKAEFASIESLCSINFWNTNSNPLSLSHCLYIDGHEVKELEIPASVTSIGNYTFQGCSGLTSVTIPDAVTYIGDNAFRNCSGLTSVTFGNSVKTIGSNAFEGCSGLTSVTIPDAVTYIGNSAFQDCSGLTSVTLGNSVKTIGNYAFSGCNGLENVNVKMETTISLDASVFENDTYNVAILNVPVDAVASYTSTNWWSYFKNHVAGGYEVKAYTDDIFNYALVTDPENQYAVLVSGDYSSMVTANIPERFTDLTDESNPVRYYIKAIGSNAFKNCKKLENVSFNSRTIINSIGSSAFKGCTALTTIAIPQTVKKLGDKAFSGSGLTSITMPETVESIGKYAFENCATLSTVKIPDSVENLSDGIFSNSGLTSVSIGNSVETIGSSAFEDCSKLTSVKIPDSVTSIGNYAFKGCNSLQKSEFASIASICNINFGNGYANPLMYAHNLYVDGAEIKNLAIPESVEAIGNYAFYGCSGLTSVSIPGSVTSIGDYAFNDCSGLTSLSLLDGNEIEFGTSVFSGTNIKTAYIGRPLTAQVLPLSNLETLTIGNTVTEIGASVWKNATRLSELTLGSSLTSIGEKAFSGCTALTEVIVPVNVESIGASAFAGDSNLAKIIMGANVKSIGEKAFDGCPATEIYITAQTPPTAPNNTFSNYTGKLYLQGQDAVDAYYDAYTCWDRFDSYVMVEPSEMKCDGEDSYTGKPGDTFKLSATLMPQNVTLPQVFWRSTNPLIATVDADGVVTLHADMTEVMALADDSDESTRSCKIIAESLYADGPCAEFSITDISEGIDEVIADGGMDSEIDLTMPVEIFSINGVRVASTIDALAPGIYIIRQGTAVKKIAVK